MRTILITPEKSKRKLNNMTIGNCWVLIWCLNHLWLFIVNVINLNRLLNADNVLVLIMPAAFGFSWQLAGQLVFFGLLLKGFKLPPGFYQLLLVYVDRKVVMGASVACTIVRTTPIVAVQTRMLLSQGIYCLWKPWSGQGGHLAFLLPKLWLFLST